MGEGLRIPGESHTVAVMKTGVTQLAQTSAERGGEIVFDALLSPIRSVDLKEIQLLSRFLPVIVLISKSTAGNEVALRDIPVAKRGSETFDKTKLLGVLGKAVERFQANSAESTFAFGNVIVNLSGMEVLRDGQPIELTSKEFKTLKYLIWNARRVISRDELLNEVWGYDNYPCTRTVDNHILKLRRKLERDPPHPVHFCTVHGVGYKFLP